MLRNADDKTLLSSFNEQTAFRILYDRYWQILYEKSFHRLGNDADAQDVVQDVFISLWKNRQTIIIEKSLSPYLFTALKYCIIKKIYRMAGKGIITPLSVEELDCKDISAEDSVACKELQNFINKEVEILPERMQEIYRLSRHNNLSNKEIAKQLSISEQTVKNTLSTALRKLKMKLSHFLFSVFY